MVNMLGRKSYVSPPPKLASSVAYPFAFIKPCGVHGDVTLKDINQRIRTPPPQKMQQSNEDPSTSYPTSAFSGKPVVGKMKIRTEGGRGSITVMRTKGWVVAYQVKTISSVLTFLTALFCPILLFYGLRCCCLLSIIGPVQKLSYLKILLLLLSGVHISHPCVYVFLAVFLPRVIQ